MSERRTSARRRSDRLQTEIFSALAAIAAIFAPASLTGASVLDAIERALIAGFVTYIGAHGRRWAWLAAAVAVVVPARGASLALALAALAVLAACGIPRRRPRAWGAVGLGLLVNAVLWYPSEVAPWGTLVGTAAMALVVASGFPHLRSSRRRAAASILIGATALVVLAGIGALVAVGLSYREVQAGGSSARQALNSARDGDADAATTSLDAAQVSFDAAASRLSGPLAAPAALVPGLAQQVGAVQTTVDQGRTITAVADDLVATADYDRLQYDRRLDLTQVEALAAPTARVAWRPAGRRRRRASNASGNRGSRSFACQSRREGARPPARCWRRCRECAKLPGVPAWRTLYRPSTADGENRQHTWCSWLTFLEHHMAAGHRYSRHIQQVCDFTQ